MSRRASSASPDQEILGLLGREDRAMALREMIRSLGVPTGDRPAFR